MQTGRTNISGPYRPLQNSSYMRDVFSNSGTYAKQAESTQVSSHWPKHQSMSATQPQSTSSTIDHDLQDLRAEDFNDDDIDLEIKGQHSNKYLPEPQAGTLQPIALGQLRQPSECLLPCLPHEAASPPRMRESRGSLGVFRTSQEQNGSNNFNFDRNAEKVTQEMTSQLSNKIKEESEKIFNDFRIPIFRGLDANLKRMRTKYEELGKLIAQETIAEWVKANQSGSSRPHGYDHIGDSSL